MSKRENLIWLDLEMTGLDPQNDHILEIATIVTDNNLNIQAEGPVIAIHQSPKILSLMDEWNVSHHTKTGLLSRVESSKTNEIEAEQETLHFLRELTSEKKSPLCGNTIHHDRKFLARFMPTLEAYFHYRNLDVSTIKELVRRWAPKIAKELTKRSEHKALQDIRDSINELKFYRERVFKI